MIRLKRVYEEEDRRDGVRYLVERLWPRAMKKAALRLDGWLKDVAPSSDLRAWFGHDPSKWAVFRKKYSAELNRHPEAWAPIRDAARSGTVTLLYSSRDTGHNNAVALKEYLERKMGTKTRLAGGR